jgi:hypothetical protein
VRIGSGGGGGLQLMCWSGLFGEESGSVNIGKARVEWWNGRVVCRLGVGGLWLRWKLPYPVGCRESTEAELGTWSHQ